MSFARRALQGVTLHRLEKVDRGFTLFTPMGKNPSDTWLIDMHGRLLHRWRLAGWVRQHAVLLPTGNLLYGMASSTSPLADLPPFVGGEIVEMDWEGRIVWRYQESYHHSHDFCRMKNGNTLITKFVPVPENIAASVKGGTPGSELHGVIWGDMLQEVTPEGEIAWEWVSHEHLDPELDCFTPIARRFCWPLWNSLVELPDGNILTCSPCISNIYIIDKTTGAIKWRWGQGIISFPHNPSLLDNGNILLFDNGKQRMYPGPHTPPDFSRIIEVNPTTKEIEWEYKEENPVDFFSSFIGGCQRLSNGNTLICEGAMGRIFEVTPGGELVWEYLSPFFHRHPNIHFGLTNAVFRAHRYSPDYPGLHGKRLDPEKLHTWNRLYGPDAFGSGAMPSRTAVEEEPMEGEREAGERTKEEFEEAAKPSVGKPGEEKLHSRLELLGY